MRPLVALTERVGANSGPPEAAGVAAGIATSLTACHCSKSLVANTSPELVRAYNRAPSGEYHTRSTGPVPTDGKDRLIAEFPTCRQSSAGVCARADTSPTSRAAHAAQLPVALRHIRRVILYPFSPLPLLENSESREV